MGSKDNELALKAIARVEKQIELEARLLGELAIHAKMNSSMPVQPPSKDLRDQREELRKELEAMAERVRISSAGDIPDRLTDL